MITEDKESIKNKAFSINSLMQNKSLAKIISDSFGSAVGSTKNQEAKAILKSLEKSNNNYNYFAQDGKGGAGGFGDWLGGLDNSINQKKSTVEDSVGNVVRGVDSFLEKKTPSLTDVVDFPSKVGEKIGEGIKGVGDFTIKNVLYPTIPSRKITIKGKEDFPEYSFKDPNKKYFQFTDKPEVYEKIGDKIGRHISYEEATKNNIWDQIEKETVMPEGYTPEGKVMYDKAIGPSPEIGTVNWFNDPNISDENKQAFINELDPSEKDFYRTGYEASGLAKSAKEAYDLGLGSEWYSLTRMMDKDKLAKDLGMSPEAAKLLPEAFLQTQLIDLENARRDEFKIDEQRDNLFQKQLRGLTIEGDLKSYVRGKDKYLGQVDKLLDETNERIVKMDTSNPYVAERMKNYTNYLTILKGRQNQRYIDFLDTSIDFHKADIKQSEAFYDRSLEEVTRLINQDETTTTEWHGTIKTMLKDLYDNIEYREDRQMELEEHEWKKAEAAADIVEDGMRSLSVGGMMGLSPDIAKRFEEDLEQQMAKLIAGDYSHGTKSPREVLVANLQAKYPGIKDLIKDIIWGTGAYEGKGILPDGYEDMIQPRWKPDEAIEKELVDLFTKYKKQGYDREQIEKDYGEKLTIDHKIALDAVFGEGEEKKSFWDFLKY